MTESPAPPAPNAPLFADIDDVTAKLTQTGYLPDTATATAVFLADRLGNLDFVARGVVKAEEVVDYTPRDNVAERLAKRFGAAIGQGAVRALRELPRLH